MATYRLQLLDWPKTKISGPKAEIALKTYSSVDYKGNPFISISHECLNLAELESEVDKLIAELHEIKKDASKLFGS